MKRCPNCGGQRFVVIAHVAQTWKVDKNGMFVNCLEDCIDVIHKPDDDDIWECYDCGYEATGKDFNVKEKK